LINKIKLIDLHCDTIEKLSKDSHSELLENHYHVDIKKLRDGNSLAQFFALFIDAKEVPRQFINDLTAYTNYMLDIFNKEIENNKELISLTTNYEDLIKNSNQDRISAFLTIESGEVIGLDINNLDDFYNKGVRLLTLTWNYKNNIGYPNFEKKYINKGLTEFGIQVVERMNDLGMIIDVSHLSDKGFYDVARLSKRPFVASHSNSRTITNNPRNLTDDMIRIISNKGGIIGVNFYSLFLGENKVSKIDNIIRHIKYIRQIGGIDVIGIGSDFDGINCELDIQNIGQIDKLISGLYKEKFKDDEIEKIFYKNSLRLIKDIL